MAVPQPSVPQPLLLKYPGAGSVGSEESAQGAAGDSFLPGHEGGLQQCQKARAMHQGAAHRDCQASTRHHQKSRSSVRWSPFQRLRHQEKQGGTGPAPQHQEWRASGQVPRNRTLNRRWARTLLSPPAIAASTSHTDSFLHFTYHKIPRICPCNNRRPPPFFATLAKYVKDSSVLS